MRVWDPFVRLFHWALVVFFGISYATAEEVEWLHANVGFFIGILVVFRIFWGFVGNPYARFSSFVRSPVEVGQHLRDVVLFRSRRYLGHDPAGGAMIVALLLMSIATVATGWLVYGTERHAVASTHFAGRAVGMIVLAQATALASPDDSETQRHKGSGSKRIHNNREEDSLEELHETLANVTLFLIALHIAGVLMVSLQTRENLILSMITGRKRILEG